MQCAPSATQLDPIAELNVSTIARLSGRPKSQVSRLGKRHAFGKPTHSGGIGGQLYFARAAVEKFFGQIFTDEQIRRAIATSPVPEAAKVKLTPATLEIEFAKIAAAFHGLWTRWLSDKEFQKQHPNGPGHRLASEVLAKLDLYTAEQLTDAIHNALDARDAEWKEFNRSGMKRALYGSAPLRRVL